MESLHNLKINFFLKSQNSMQAKCPHKLLFLTTPSIVYFVGPVRTVDM